MQPPGVNSLGSICDLLKRDTFYAEEIDIFKAISKWAQANRGQDPTPLMEVVRLQVLI